MTPADKSMTSKMIRTPDGTKRWYSGSQLHRDDGPAFEGIDGTQMWFRHGQMHREDGPALIQPDGSREWWLNGKNFSEKEFDAALVRLAREKRAAEDAEQAKKQAAIDSVHQQIAEQVHDRLRRTAKTIKPPKLGKP